VPPSTSTRLLSGQSRTLPALRRSTRWAQSMAGVWDESPTPSATTGKSARRSSPGRPQTRITRAGAFGRPVMVPEAQLESAEHGLVPKGDGWFVLNAREARWRHGERRGAICEFEGEPYFPHLGINLRVPAPGQPMAMYHWEAGQEDFLVIGRGAFHRRRGRTPPTPMGPAHCPAGTKHVIVGAGDAPCLVLAVGARGRSTGADWGYGVDDAALRHGAGVEQETTDAKQAYARFPRRKPTRYREGWLPDALTPVRSSRASRAARCRRRSALRRRG
jgi:uncharacterized cupin superfamily protein